MPYLRNSIVYDHDFWYISVKWWYLQVFIFIFLIFSFLGLLGGWKDKKQLKKKNNNYIRHTPYLRNSIAYDHDFWYTCVKWWYLQVLFFIFSKFWFFGLLGGSKGKKIAQNDKRPCPLHFISQEPYIIWSWFMVRMCKRLISLGVFYIFSKF